MQLTTLEKHILLAMRVLTRDDLYSLISRSDLGAFAFGTWNDSRQAALQSLIRAGHLNEILYSPRLRYYSLTQQGLAASSPNVVYHLTSLLA